METKQKKTSLDRHEWQAVWKGLLWAFLLYLCVILIVLVSISFSGASVTGIESTGDNMKAYKVSYNKTDVWLNEHNWWLHVKIKTDNANDIVTVHIYDLNRVSYPISYWTSKTPTLKYSCNNWDWNYAQYVERKDNGDLTYEIKPGCTSFRIATFAAYPYYSALNQVKTWAKASDVSVTYQKSPKGLNFPIMEITDTTATGLKKCVAMTFRQHAGEIYSHWYMYGFIKSLYSGRDKTFLRSIDLLVFPIANPDGVYYSEVHANALKQDLNDCWDRTDCLEVETMKQAMIEFAEKCGSVDLYIDWHGGNLGLYDTNTILVRTEEERQLCLKFQTGTSFKKCQVYKDTPEKSAYWVRENFPGVKAMTMEIQMHRDDVNNPPAMIKEGEIIKGLVRG